MSDKPGPTRRERIVVLLDNEYTSNTVPGHRPATEQAPWREGVYEMERPEFDEFAWFVGLFEGEGTVSATPQRWKGGKARYLHFQIGMTDEDVVRAAHRIIGRGSVTGPYIRRSGFANAKPLWFWGAYGHNARQIAYRLLPHLHSRRKAQLINAMEEAGIALNEEQLALVEDGCTK